jgi:hypothetical protein
VAFLDDLYFPEQMGHLDQPFHNLFDVFVHVDYLGHDPLHDLDGRWGVDDLGFLLELEDLGDFLDDGHQLFHQIRNLSQLVDGGSNLNDLFFETVHLLYLLLDVDLRDFLELILVLHHDPLFNLGKDLRLPLDDQLLDYLLHYMWHRLNVHGLSVDVDWHCFLHRDWEGHFDWRN